MMLVSHKNSYYLIAITRTMFRRILFDTLHILRFSAVSQEAPGLTSRYRRAPVSATALRGAAELLRRPSAKVEIPEYGDRLVPTKVSYSTKTTTTSIRENEKWVVFRFTRTLFTSFEITYSFGRTSVPILLLGRRVVIVGYLPRRLEKVLGFAQNDHRKPPSIFLKRCQFVSHEHREIVFLYLYGYTLSNSSTRTVLRVLYESQLLEWKCSTGLPYTLPNECVFRVLEVSKKRITRVN